MERRTFRVEKWVDTKVHLVCGRGLQGMGKGKWGKKGGRPKAKWCNIFKHKNYYWHLLKLLQHLVQVQLIVYWWSLLLTECRFILFRPLRWKDEINFQPTWNLCSLRKNVSFFCREFSENSRLSPSLLPDSTFPPSVNLWKTQSQLWFRNDVLNSKAL